MGMLVSDLLPAPAARDATLSGPQPAEKASGFKVFDVATRKEADYIALYSGEASGRLSELK